METRTYGLQQMSDNCPELPVSLYLVVLDMEYLNIDFDEVEHMGRYRTLTKIRI